MTKRETKHLKALYFDLRVKDLERYFSEANPNGAYRKIQKFLENHAFLHVQYSGYHSKAKTTDLEIFDLVNKMRQEFPWLDKCLNHFEVTNVGVNHDLMQLFDNDVVEPDDIKGS